MRSTDLSNFVSPFTCPRFFHLSLITERWIFQERKSFKLVRLPLKYTAYHNQIQIFKYLVTLYLCLSIYNFSFYWVGYKKSKQFFILEFKPLHHLTLTPQPNLIFYLYSLVGFLQVLGFLSLNLKHMSLFTKPNVIHHSVLNTKN